MSTCWESSVHKAEGGRQDTAYPVDSSFSNYFPNMCEYLIIYEYWYTFDVLADSIDVMYFGNGGSNRDRLLKTSS